VFRNALLAAAASFVPTDPARAWCGEQVPSWAFYLKWDENPKVPFEFNGVKGSCFCRVVGDLAREQKAGVPPILIVGDPGIGYDYMENLETLAVSDRRLVEVNFAGSASAVPDALLSYDACAAQLQAVVRSLQVQQVHVIAHGLGAPAALRFVRLTPSLTRSLTLVSPYGSAADLRPAMAEAAAAALKGGRADTSALLPTVSGNARGSCIADAAQAAGGPLFTALLGSSERLGGERLATKLDGLEVPTLLSYGRSSDEIVEVGWPGLPAAVVTQPYEQSGHLPFVEERDRFLFDYVEFLDKADGVATNRELKFADPLKMVKEVMSDSVVGAPPKDCTGYKSDAARAYCERSNSAKR